MGSAQVAQLVEHVTENHGVGGSIPPLGTIAAGRVEHRYTRAKPAHEAKELAMRRITWACVVVALCASFAVPGFAQTNEACMLRCLDHGNLDQTCTARCTNGVPPAAPVAPNRASVPAQQPAPQSAPPLATQSPPAASQPANVVPSSPSVVRPAPQPAQNFAAPPPPAQNAAPLQPVQNQAPPQPAAQSAPQQVAKPPAPPVNQMCVLHCLDHGHLDQYCERVCTVKSSPP